PGMTHTQGGPSTDQHNSLAALVNWVENDAQPDSIHAWVKPTNKALPEEWSDQRSRPLCAYPEIATYTGGDLESASSFECQIAEKKRYGLAAHLVHRAGARFRLVI